MQHIHPHWNSDEPSNVIADRCHRARINSAIFVSSEGRGFDSIEFIRRYGSQSVLCRKAKSAENIPAGNRNVSTLVIIFIYHNFQYFFKILHTKISDDSQKIHRVVSYGKVKSIEIHHHEKKLKWLSVILIHH